MSSNGLPERRSAGMEGGAVLIEKRKPIAWSFELDAEPSNATKLSVLPLAAFPGARGIWEAGPGLAIPEPGFRV
jgi:hypothetical protein